MEGEEEWRREEGGGRRGGREMQGGSEMQGGRREVRRGGEEPVEKEYSGEGQNI